MTAEQAAGLEQFLAGEQVLVGELIGGCQMVCVSGGCPFRRRMHHYEQFQR